ncbi:MAG: VacJ family lipoprotein [Pseudomonadota bacterium]
MKHPQLHLNFLRRLALVALAALVLQGCATGQAANTRDPWEPFNRSVYNFNEGLDEALIKPVATAYQTVIPSPVRNGVTNFFDNISDVWSTVNNVLQLKPRESVEMMLRVGVNTTLGLGGVLDVASEMRLNRHREDFGQTLGYWGIQTGPYVVLPVLGPSTLRDSLALTVDGQGDLVTRISDVPLRNSLYSLRAVDIRAGLLRAGQFLNDVALDKYSFTRDAYLQRRRGQVREETSLVPERFDLPEEPALATAAQGKDALPQVNKTSP